MKQKIFIIIIIVFFSTPSFAYIDPGTGAFLVQAIFAFFASVVLYLSRPIKHIKKLFNKIFAKKKKI